MLKVDGVTESGILGRICMSNRLQHRRASVETALVIAMVAITLVAGAIFLGAAANSAFSGLEKDSDIARSGKTHPSARAGSTKKAERPSNVKLVFAVLVTGAVAALSGAGLIFLAGDKRNGRKPEDQRSPDLPVQSRLYDFLLLKRQNLLRGISGDETLIDKNRLEVRYLMTRKPRTISGMMLRDDVEAMMNRQGVHHVLVVDGDQKLLGVISDRDMKRPAKNAFELMTPQPVSVSPHDLASPAISLMMDRRISCLPVVNAEGVVVGVLTGTDLLMGFQCVLQALSSHGQENVAAAAPRQSATPQS